ncbi:MAG: amino acid ABC transporter permease [Bacilli bacterium]
MSSWDKIVSLLEGYYLTFLNGICSTLLLAIVGTFVGLFFGILIGLARNMKIKETDNAITKFFKRVLKVIVSIYVNFFRGTPMMVQSMIIFFGLSALGVKWTQFDSWWIFNGYMYCGLFVISINTAAYMAEIIRSGLNGVDIGQEEACRSLGMPYFKTMFTVIMPQAIRNSLPTILNEYIVNVKDSSVLNVIGLTELYASVSIATNKNYFKVEGYIIIAVIYLILTLLATLIVKLIERKLDGKKVFINPFKHSKPVNIGGND